VAELPISLTHTLAGELVGIHQEPPRYSTEAGPLPTGRINADRRIGSNSSSFIPSNEPGTDVMPVDEIISDRAHGPNENITINGVRLADAVQAEGRADIRAHLRHEQSKLAAQCGLRRSASPRRALGRPGRPRRAISLVLARELEPFLLDESLPLEGIADLFKLSISVVRAYMKWLGVTRERGRKRNH
jgi:hypothetical protein